MFPGHVARRRPGERVIDVFSVSWRTVFVAAVSWAFVATAVALRLPEIAPTPSAPRELETLGTFSLILPVSIQVSMLQARMPWLLRGAVRSPAGLRARWLAGVAVLNAGACTAVASLMLLPVRPFILIWLLLSGASLLALAAVGVRAGAAAPFVVLVSFSLGSGLPPWHINIIYNPDLEPVLRAVALVVAVVGVVAYLRFGERCRD